MNAVQKERLLTLADFLINILPPDKFDFGVVVKGKDQPRKELDCGSVGCAIGWCPVLFPTVASYRADGEYYDVITHNEENDECDGHISAGVNIFGISAGESYALFDPSYGDEEREELGLLCLDGESSAAEVGENIRLFVQRKEEGLI